MVDGRYSILVELSALSAGKTLVVDGMTEHLEMPILFLAFSFNLAWILGFCTHHQKDISDDEVGHPPIASLAAVTTSAFSPISTATQLQSSSRYAAPASNSQLFAMPICIVVEAEIKEDRMDEFLDMIEKNAVGSRAEPGCIRFGMY